MKQVGIVQAILLLETVLSVLIVGQIYRIILLLTYWKTGTANRFVSNSALQVGSV